MMEPAAIATAAGAPASFSSPTAIATARAMRNAIAGLSSTNAAIIEHCAQLGRVLMASAPPEFTLPGHLLLEWLLTD
jgi:hypothetical protein